MRFCFFTNARTSSNDAEDSNRSVLYPMFPRPIRNLVSSSPRHHRRNEAASHHRCS